MSEYSGQRSPLGEPSGQTRVQILLRPSRVTECECVHSIVTSPSYSGDWLTPTEPLRRLTTLRTLQIPSGSLEEKLAFGLLRYASAARVSLLKAKILLLNLPLNKNSC